MGTIFYVFSHRREQQSNTIHQSLDIVDEEQIINFLKKSLSMLQRVSSEF